MVLTAANSWNDQRMADHQLAVALARSVPVLYVEQARSILRRRRRDGDVPATTGVRVLRPVRLPLSNNVPVAWINRFIVAAQVRRAVAAMAGRTVVLLEANMVAPLTGLIGEHRVVYWAQDDWQGLAPLVGLDPRVLAGSERRVRRGSDAVIAANPVVAASFTPQDDVRLIPFGADTSLFRTTGSVAPADDFRRPGEPVAVLMGTLNTRIDFDLLDAVATAGVHVLLIGPVTDDAIEPRLARLTALPTVTWLGERPFSAMPRYLAHAAVGLVPYVHSAFNDGSFPLKTLEYLAAGLPVVATDLPAVRWLDSPDISISDDPAGFAAAVKRLAAGGIPAADERARRARFADAHDWSARAEAFYGVVTGDVRLGPHSS